ncbi:MAG: preprotein translocase subunit SecY [Candidatus Ranarchaeia archaeon]
MSSRFLSALRPLLRFTPEVRTPERKVSFREKLLWTAVALILYLVMSQIPLFGVEPQAGVDYLYWMRVITASSRGTLMELGIGPIVTAGLVMQLLVGSQIIKVNFNNPEDRANYTGAQKLFSMVMIGFNAFAYLFAGAYGTISLSQQILVFVQLIFGGIVVMLLDEMLQKGWGIGSGISLFIAAGVSQQVLWGLFAPLPTGLDVAEGIIGDNLFRGAVLAFIQALIYGIQGNVPYPPSVTPANPGGVSGLPVWFLGSFNRPGGFPGITAVLATAVVFLIVVYIESVRVELPLSHAQYKGFHGKYPIKLLYTSNIPVILVQALYANLLLGTQVLQTLFNSGGGNFWVDLIGTFNTDAGRLDPVSGLVYYLTPPRGLDLVFADPIRALIYGIAMILLCGAFASLWIEVAGLTPRDISRQLMGAGVVVPGFRRSPKVIETLLSRFIPTVTLLGGLIMGALATFADFLNALGTGAGILLTVGIIYQYYELIAEEQISEMGTAFRALAGR